MPRSSHSATSYFNCRATGSPQRLQNVTMFLLNVPHLWQSTSPAWNGSVRISRRSSDYGRWCADDADPSGCRTCTPSCRSNSRRTRAGSEPRKSEIGKTELKTLCKPASSRSFGSRSICRNRSYERFWTSIRLGIGIEVLIFEKSTLSRREPFKNVGHLSLSFWKPVAQ